jgi:hypothetical protein
LLNLLLFRRKVARGIREFFAPTQGKKSNGRVQNYFAVGGPTSTILVIEADIISSYPFIIAVPDKNIGCQLDVGFVLFLSSRIAQSSF